MKFFGKLLLPLIVLLVMGCSQDDSVAEPTETVIELAGTWKLYSYSYSGLKTEINQEDVVQSLFDGIGWEINLNMQLSESPNNFTTTGTYFVDHLVTSTEGEETLYYGYFDVSDTGTWSRTNNGIAFTQDGITLNGTITNLTENSLEYTLGSFSSTTEYDGTIVNITRTDVYSFVRE